MRAHEAPHLLTVRSQLFGVLLARRGPTVTAWSSLGYRVRPGPQFKELSLPDGRPIFSATTCGCLRHGVTCRGGSSCPCSGPRDLKSRALGAAHRPSHFIPSLRKNILSRTHIFEGPPRIREVANKSKCTTLSGGSLGSCVDEERS